MRHFYVAHAAVRLWQRDGSRRGTRAWKSALRDLVAAARRHPSLLAHLHLLEAAELAWRGEHAAAEMVRTSALRIGDAHDNLLVGWEVARQRGVAAARAGDQAGADAAFALADEIATSQAWTARRDRLRDAIISGNLDPRWSWGARGAR